MGIYPTLRAGYQRREVTEVFGGYNHNLKIGDGEFYNMQNLTSDHYPLLANRPKRAVVRQVTAPHALLGKSQLAYVDGTALYYGDLDLTPYFTAKGLAISDDEAMLPKQLVSMGAYMVLYPDRLYINTEDFTDCGSMEARFTTGENGGVTYTPCTADGTAYPEAVVSPSAPSEPANGALWMDTSGQPHSLKQYSAASAVWTAIPTVYIRIGYPGIGAAFAQFDGVRISGCGATPQHSTALQSQLAALNGSHVIQSCSEDAIVVAGVLDQAFTQSSGSITVARLVPDMDFIIEAGNRLWGCRYGLADGKTVNAIYCCALGDFKNWEQYQGLSTDSYRASVGTDGPWTGAVTYLGYPIFFKENCLHKVYVSAAGAHQIVDTACRGVQQGSHNSLAVVNETLYYKSVLGICAYDGSLPVSVSAQLGSERYFYGAAGALGDKYYISMADGNDRWHLFVLDTDKGFWHREDDTQVLQFARCGGELYGAAGQRLIAFAGSRGTPEGDVEWMAETGLIGYSTVERKYVSRFNLRMKLPAGSSMDVYIQYDSLGPWQHAGHVTGAGTNTFLIPLRPRRCDHFRIRLTGVGDVRIYSFAKMMERGSDIV